MKLSYGISIGLLLFAVILESVVDQPSAAHKIAEQYIGVCEAVEFDGASAFQSSDKTAIVFESEGFQGPIQALFIITNEEIEKLAIVRSMDGMDRSILKDPEFLTSFEQNTKELPIQVDAISGATISSQIIIDDMNRHLKKWNEKDD